MRKVNNLVTIGVGLPDIYEIYYVFVEIYRAMRKFWNRCGIVEKSGIEVFLVFSKGRDYENPAPEKGLNAEALAKK